MYVSETEETNFCQQYWCWLVKWKWLKRQFVQHHLLHYCNSHWYCNCCKNGHCSRRGEWVNKVSLVQGRIRVCFLLECLSKRKEMLVLYYLWPTLSHRLHNIASTTILLSFWMTTVIARSRSLSHCKRNKTVVIYGESMDACLQVY